MNFNNMIFINNDSVLHKTTFNFRLSIAYTFSFIFKTYRVGQNNRNTLLNGIFII